MTPKILKVVKPTAVCSSIGSNFKPKFMEHWAQQHGLLSLPTSTSPRNVANVGGDKSYMLVSSLANLETALMRWAMNELITKFRFTPVTVPNIIYDHIIDRCGFPTRSERSQVYKVSGTCEESIIDENAPLRGSTDRTHSCIAGTSEFAIAAIHIGDTIPSEELPRRYCAASRCYRAEASSLSSEWGLYRVHYFNKVEMFGFSMPDKSNQLHEEFLDIQNELFKQLDLQYRVLDMPEDDLGLSAKKKYDIEAWLRGRQRYGEISSTSNCEDYQSSRLNIKYSDMVQEDGQLQLNTGFVHTVNGTACSTIRTLIAIIEQHQIEDGRVKIPKALVPYMKGIDHLPTADDTRLLNEIDLYPTPK